MIFKKNKAKKEKRENDCSHDLVIRSPRSIGIAGVVELVIGCLLSTYCYLDYLNGNETASVGIALGFLLIPGVTGILLILYSSRTVTVMGEDIVFRDFLLRGHQYRFDDITRVIWSVDGYAFMEKTKKLFKLYEYSASCERLLLELEKRGVELDIPGRSFGSERSAAIHPCPAKRRFTIHSYNCSLRYGGKLNIEGRNLLLCRRIGKEVRCTVSELTEVHIKENKEGRIFVRIFYKDHKLLFKTNGFAGDFQDTHYVFALVRHLFELGVPLQGMENVDESVLCIMRKQFVNSEDAVMVFKEEYERILPVIKKYETELKEAGYQLRYGAIDRNEMKTQISGLFPNQEIDSVFVYGYYFCLTRENKLVYVKKQQCPMYQCSSVMTREPESLKGRKLYDEDLKDLIYFEPIAEPAIQYILEYFQMMIKKKKTYLSDQQFSVQT